MGASSSTGCASIEQWKCSRTMERGFSKETPLKGCTRSNVITDNSTKIF